MIVTAAGGGDDAPAGAPAVTAEDRRQREGSVVDRGALVPAEAGALLNRRRSRLTSRTHSCTSIPSSGAGAVAGPGQQRQIERERVGGPRSAARRRGRPARLHPVREVDQRHGLSRELKQAVG